MHRHRKKPSELQLVLDQFSGFSGGEFILKKGRGWDTPIFSGKIENIEIPSLSVPKIFIHPRFLYERGKGCDGDFSDEWRWKRIDPLPTSLEFDYSWFYPQPRHARLKLEFVREEDKDNGNTAEVDDRCWLCSHTDPIYLKLFRSMLITMFLEESVKKQKSFARRLRDRFFLS